MYPGGCYDAEVKKIWDACGQPCEDLPANYCSLVKLLICCGQRRGEIAALQSSWIDPDEKTCTLPREVCKNGREHTFPLGDLASDFLRPLLTRELLLFPARGKASPSNG
jgi:integrase